MPTYNGKPYTAIRNIKLKGGLLLFGKVYTSNPCPSDKDGLWVDSNHNLNYSRQGVEIDLDFRSLSPSKSPSRSPSVSPSVSS
jgi:hypothetical protein